MYVYVCRCKDKYFSPTNQTKTTSEVGCRERRCNIHISDVFSIKKHSQDIANDAAQPIGKHPEEQDDKNETNPCTCISEAL